MKISRKEVMLFLRRNSQLRVTEIVFVEKPRRESEDAFESFVRLEGPVVFAQTAVVVPERKDNR